MATFNFYPLTIPYAKQMHAWLQKPHVRAFWDDGDRTFDQVRAHYFTSRAVEQYLILSEKKPSVTSKRFSFMGTMNLRSSAKKRKRLLASTFLSERRTISAKAMELYPT